MKRDDYIQGIMFSRTGHIDLRRMSHSERNTYKMLATKNTLRDWTSQHSMIQPADKPLTTLKPRTK